MVDALRLLIDSSVAAGCVVIDYHLMALPVAFTWGEDDGASPFQHRNQIGYDNCLGKQVLTGTEEWGALPFPNAVVNVEIGAVTGPYAEVTVLESVGDGIGQ